MTMLHYWVNPPGWAGLVDHVAVFCIEIWQLVIEDNFSHAEDPIRVRLTVLCDVSPLLCSHFYSLWLDLLQKSAASAFGAVCREYYKMADTTDEFIERFIDELDSTNRFSR